MDTSAIPARIPIKKASHTCATCRARKVRCDGRRSVCSNCERLGFPCSYDYGAAMVQDLTSAMSVSGGDFGDDGQVVPKRRARQACQNCHSRKARCSGGTPVCDRCQALGINCVYRLGKRSRIRSVSGSATGGDVSGNDLAASNCGQCRPPGQPEADTCRPGAASIDGAENETLLLSVDILESMAMKTFDNFFGHVHHIPTFAFLHRASLMQRFHAGLVEKSLLLALVGVTSLMTDLGPGTRDLGTRCIAEAEALALGGLEKPSTLALQTLVFVMHHRILSGRLSSAFMLHGVASRLASALRLEHEDDRLCFLARESRRRLMWALYMIDVSMASSQIDSSLWMHKSDAISIQLPCNERNFEFDIPEISEPLQPPEATVSQTLPPLPDSTGFLALHVRIHFLRGRILQYTKHAVHNPQAVDLASIPTRCAVLAGELEAFAARLPASFRWSEANVRLRTYSPRLCVFLMTHVWWEQCFNELYRFALPNLEGALPAPYATQLEVQCPDFVQHCRHQAYKHAMAMVGIFRLLLALDSGIPVTDLDLPICLHQCARMLHYFRQTGFYEATALQQEPVIDSIRLCIRVLERCIKTPATLRIVSLALPIPPFAVILLYSSIKSAANDDGARKRENLDSLIARELAQLAPSVSEHTDIMDADMDGMVPGLFQPLLAGDVGSQTTETTEHRISQPRGYLRMAQAHSDLIGTDSTVSMRAENDIPAIGTTTAYEGPATCASSSPMTPTLTASATDSLHAVLATQGGALDAFDLDIDGFGPCDFASWFSGDWPTADLLTSW